MDNQEKNSETYNTLNNRAVEGAKEFYLFSGIILTVLSAIFALSRYEAMCADIDKNPLSLNTVGLIIAIIWFLGSISQIMWKRWWAARIDKVENIIFERSEDLQKLQSKNSKDEPRLFCLPLHFTFIFGLLPAFFIISFVIDLVDTQNNFIAGISVGILMGILFGFLIYASYLYRPKGIKNLRHIKDC